MARYSVLVVEDNSLVGMGLQATLAQEGFEVELAECGKVASGLLQTRSFDIALLDMRLPDVTGRELLTAWHEAYPEMAIIFLTGHATVELAVDCLKAGAYDFLTKPVERPILLKSLRHAIDHLQLTRKVERLEGLSQRVTDTRLIGETIAFSPAGMQINDLASRVAESDFSCVLITGESGTGKGLMARTLHKLGRRANHPFVELNSSAIPSHLIESELFGHVKGSFTDAKVDKFGLFEMADKGTLFLDEIGDMEVGLQAKLLKAMEEQRFRRIGGTKEIAVDVAIIAATNQNIDDAIASGAFRADLYYRLNVLPLHLPPLRERREDIVHLAEHFLQVYARKLGKAVVRFSDEVLDEFMAYAWPGNIRELRNVVERGCILTRGTVIDDVRLLFPAHNRKVTLPVMPPGDPSSGPGQPVLPLELAEKQTIHAAMRQTGGNRNEAARMLGIHRTTLYKKLQAYGLE